MAAPNRFNTLQLGRTLSNFWTTLYEQKRQMHNRVLRDVITSFDGISIASESVIDEYVVATPRYYSDLTITGDNDSTVEGAYHINAGDRVQYGAGVLDETTLWVVFRIRPDWGSGEATTHYLLDWRNDANNRIVLYWDGTLTSWVFGRYAAGVGTDSAIIAGSHSASDDITLAAYLTATEIALIVDGVSDDEANANIPTLSAASFDIGTQAGATPFDGHIHWAAVGRGSFTAADFTVLDALGNADPAFSDFPLDTWPDLDISFLWYGDDETHTPMGRYGEARYSA